MKKVITSILILCLIAVLFCGCGKKTDKGGAESSNASGTSSQISMTEGVDEISVENIEENAVEIDFETGSIISAPANKDNSSSSSSPSENLGTPSTSTSSASSSSEASSSDSGSDSSSDASGVQSQDTMSGFSPWQ